MFAVVSARYLIKIRVDFCLIASYVVVVLFGFRFVLVVAFDALHQPRVSDGISDGGSFPQCVESPFAAPNWWWWWQRFIKIECHELVLNTWTVVFFLFL